MIIMNLRNATILPLAVVLGSCSYLYDVVAVLQDGVSPLRSLLTHANNRNALGASKS